MQQQKLKEIHIQFNKNSQILFIKQYSQYLTLFIIFQMLNAFFLAYMKIGVYTLLFPLK